jgi:hypothetical protein
VEALAVALVELLPALAFVDVEVVEHDVDITWGQRAATASMCRSISSALRVALHAAMTSPVCT